MEVVIKTEDSSSREEENPHIKTNKKIIEEPSNNDCFVTPYIEAKPHNVSTFGGNQQNCQYDAEIDPHLFGLNMASNSKKRQQNRQQKGDNIPQLHYYNNNNNNSNSSNNKNKNSGITSINSLNQHYASLPLGTRCGEIFVTHNAKKWTFACTFCIFFTRDIGAFILHLQKMHLNTSAFNDNINFSDEDDDVDELICMDDENEMQERSTCPSVGVQDQDYVDYSNYLDVNVHTAPGVISYHNNSSSSRKNTTNSSNEIIKKRGPGRPPGSGKKSTTVQKDPHHNHHNIKTNSQTGESKIQNTADKPESGHKKKVKSQTAANINGDAAAVATQESIDGIEIDGNSSLMDYEQDSTYQDENVWQKFGQYDDETIPDADDDAAGVGDDDDDFDNQLLFMPPPSGESSLMAEHSKMEDYIPSVRTVRRQIRGTAYCALCNKTFQYYSLYRNHMTKHSNETPFKCVVCKKGFKSKQAIRYHMHTHEKQKRHKCPLCHAAYYTENQVITHLLTHENGSIFPCMVCGKILHTDSERDQHLTTHTEERPFRCVYCNKLFRLRHHLSNHLKIHRQYRCDYCKTAFTSAVHQRKPYACFACAKHPHVQRQIAKSQSTSSSLSESKDLKPLQILEACMKSDKSMNPEIITGDRLGSSDSSSSSSSNSSNGGSSNAGSNSDAEEHDDPLDNNNHNKIYSDSSSLWENGEEGEITTSEKQRLPCTHCHRTYSNVSALNFHIRNKHA